MSPSRPDAFDEIRQRLGAAGIAYADTTDLADKPALRVEIPSGRATRLVIVGLERIEAFEAIGFESIRFLSGLDAIMSVDDGFIEALVTGRPSLQFALSSVPGAEVSPGTGEELDDEDDVIGGREQYVLRVTNGDGVTLEVSPISRTMSALTSRSRGYSIKLPCGPGMTHDAALTLLQRAAHSFFFDLDLRYGLMLDLAAAHLA